MAFSIPGGLRASLGPGGNGVRAGPKRHPGWDAMRSEAPAWLAGLARPRGWAWLGLAAFLRFIYFLRLVGLGWLALAWLGFGWIWFGVTRILAGFGLDFCIFACLC